MSEPLRDPAPAPANSIDAVIEVLKRDIDRTLVRESLALTPEQRIRRLIAFIRTARELQRGMKDSR